MELLKEIDERSKTYELDLLADALVEMGADLNSEATFEILNEIGADYRGFSDWAKGRGIDPRAADPRVAGALENPRLGLQPNSKPEKGQPVVFRSKFGNAGYKVHDVAGESAILIDPRGERYVIDVGHLSPATDENKKIIGWSANQQPEPRKKEGEMQRATRRA